MRLADLAAKFLQLSKVMHRWLEPLSAIDTARRTRIADYADEIAATLGRAGRALELCETEPDNRDAARLATRELGAIAGYVEDIVSLLRDHLDGRKLAGVRRRLDGLAPLGLRSGMAGKVQNHQIERLAEAEGYFRALADRLRV